MLKYILNYGSWRLLESRHIPQNDMDDIVIRHLHLKHRDNLDQW
jgi:hypothetical protein